MESKIDYTIYYKRWHTGAPDEYHKRANFFSLLIGSELAKLPKNASILDFGCGFGHLTHFLGTKFENVIGVDSSLEQIKIARQNGVTVEHLSQEYFFEWCKNNEAKFDAIFLMDVLEHIVAQEQITFLRKLSETLKKGGVIYIQTPNANNPLAMRWRYNDWTHTSSFSECSLEFVLANAGLSNFNYLRDDSSLRPRFFYIPRKSSIRYFLRMLARKIWKLYLTLECGNDAKQIPLGLNIFIRAEKIK
jgi:cyclopropane fatty-acyl-phospholipid synthase-like methyltransferase